MIQSASGKPTHDGAYRSSRANDKQKMSHVPIHKSAVLSTTGTTASNKNKQRRMRHARADMT
jgi:hypothetical protein